MFFGRLPFAKLGFDDLVGDIPDHGQIDDEQGGYEIPVSRNVHGPVDIQVRAVHRSFGDAEEERIQLAGGDVCREPTGHPCKGCGNTCHWVATCRREYDGRQRDHDNIASISGMI